MAELYMKLCAGIFLFITATFAQNVTVTLASEKQIIRGFGGMNCPTWGVDLTAAQATTAFGSDCS